MRDELPGESKRDLDFAGFIETLSLLEGEEVLLSIEGVSKPRPEVTTSIRAFGAVRHVSHSGGNLWAVGDGASMVLCEPDFVSASLLTFDGNDFFASRLALDR